MKRSPTEVIQSHLSKRLQGETERDIEENYSEDVLVLTSYGRFYGKDGVRESASILANDLPDAEFTYDSINIESNYGLLVWSASSTKGEVKGGVDTFVVKDSKIAVQTFHYAVN